MRPINRIILHCSASMEGIDLRASDIRAYHTNPVSQGGRGWKNLGYHYGIELSGKVVAILPESRISLPCWSPFPWISSPWSMAPTTSSARTRRRAS